MPGRRSLDPLLLDPRANWSIYVTETNSPVSISHQDDHGTRVPKQTQLYPYEENSIPEIPAWKLQLTKLHSNICTIETDHYKLKAEELLTVRGVAGLIFGLDGSKMKTDSKVYCYFEITVPEGEKKALKAAESEIRRQKSQQSKLVDWLVGWLFD